MIGRCWIVMRSNGKFKYMENKVTKLRNISTIALVIALSGTVAHADSRPAAKDIVIVHGALVDASGWRAVYDILTKDGFHVSFVQEPLTSLAEDRKSTRLN